MSITWLGPPFLFTGFVEDLSGLCRFPLTELLLTLVNLGLHVCHFLSDAYLLYLSLTLPIVSSNFPLYQFRILALMVNCWSTMLVRWPGANFQQWSCSFTLFILEIFCYILWIFVVFSWTQRVIRKLHWCKPCNILCSVYLLL